MEEGEEKEEEEEEEQEEEQEEEGGKGEGGKGEGLQERMRQQQQRGRLPSRLGRKKGWKSMCFRACRARVRWGEGRGMG